MRRKMAALIAPVLLAAALFVQAPAASAASSVFAGTWVSIDTDGSTQTLAIGQGSTPAVTFQDFYASSCDAAGAQSTHFVGTGQGVVDGDTLWVEYRAGGCGWRKIGPFGGPVVYDASTDTLTDDFGITWYRAR